ncbi:MAG: hypothetical protein LBC95_00830 [Candidatus Nomurabacteria bacterium]|jgi:hypothetical protein|nr:hypothetical protein [Candidatus Nomurabacteria bacterium]
MKKLMLVVLGVMMMSSVFVRPVGAENIPADQVFIAGFRFAPLGDSFIEIYNSAPNNVEVDDLKVFFYNSSLSQRADTVRLGGGTILAESSILIKEETSSFAEFDATYKKAWTVASGGAIRLEIDGLTRSAICWKNANDCVDSFQTGSLASSLTDGYWVNGRLNDIVTSPETYTKQSPPLVVGHGGFVPRETEDDDETEPEPELPPQYCRYLRLSEVSTTEQWIEIYNSAAQAISPENLADCVLAVQYGDKLTDGRPNYSRYRLNLGGYVGMATLAPYSYLVVDIARTEISLPKNVRDRGILLHDATTDYDEMRYSSTKADTTLAFFADGWQVTFAPTPGAENIFQRWQTCEAGKHINEATGNCVKDAEPPAECAEGQFRNPATGRCKKLAVETALAECAEGQFRNPATNRCKKIASEDDLVPCAEGWERNPETNRCRKVVAADEARFGVEPVAGSSDNGVWMAVGGAGAAAVVGLIAWQFHPEIARFARQVAAHCRRRGGV